MNAYLFVLVVPGDFSPEPDESVLEVLVNPEVCDMRACVRVPAAVLPAGSGVHVQDCVDAVLRTSSYDPVEMPEPFGFEDARSEVILEVPVVDRYANAVQPQRLEESSIGLGEEVFQEL